MPVGYAYVLPSPDVDVPAETSELGSIYVTEEVAGTTVAAALVDAAIEHAHAIGQYILRLWVAERTAGLVASTRSTVCGRRYTAPPPCDVLSTEMHEIRYRMSL